MEQVFEGSLFDAQMIKNLLENEGIPSFLGNEIIGSWGFLSGTITGVSVFVRKEDSEKALPFVEEYIKNNAAE